MDSYGGFSHDLSMGNISNSSIINSNRQVRFNNATAQTKHINDITAAKQKAKLTDTTTDQLKNMGEAVTTQIASKGKDFKFAATAAKEGIGFAKAALIDKLPVSKAVQLDTAAGNLAEGSKLVSGLKNATSVGANFAERAASVGKIGLAGSALSVGTGLMDGINDLVNHKIVGKNTAEKASNITGMAAGLLEGAGTALDLTGFGAPVGVALNVLGGLAGLVSGGAEAYGQAEEKTRANANTATLQNATVKPQKLSGVNTGGGSVVKSN